MNRILSKLDFVYKKCANVLRQAQDERIFLARDDTSTKLNMQQVESIRARFKKKSNNKIIKAIVGLGNPGQKFEYNRHNIGFLVADALVDKHQGFWVENELLNYAQINIDGRNIYVVKPQTYMNSSGKISSWLNKKGVKPEEIIVVHDDLERPFGKVTVKLGGSAQGHNGIRSMMTLFGPDFYRVRCGIGRPLNKEDVGNYVLTNFIENESSVEKMIQDAIVEIEKITKKEAAK